MICCSEFMKSKMDSNPLFATKTVAMHNFIDKVEWKETEKKDYVLYFGRFSEEKGIGTLIKVCKELPDAWYLAMYLGLYLMIPFLNEFIASKNGGKKYLCFDTFGYTTYGYE